jgi:hypothetical protein
MADYPSAKTAAASTYFSDAPTIADEIVAVRDVIADMESVKRYTPAFDRRLMSLRAALVRLEELQTHIDEAAFL